MSIKTDPSVSAEQELAFGGKPAGELKQNPVGEGEKVSSEPAKIANPEGGETPITETTKTLDTQEAAPADVKSTEQPQENIGQVKKPESSSPEVNKETEGELKKERAQTRRFGAISSSAVDALLDKSGAKQVLEKKGNEALKAYAQAKFPEKFKTIIEGQPSKQSTSEEITENELEPEKPDTSTEILADLAIRSLNSDRTDAAKDFGRDNGLNEQDLIDIQNIATGMVNVDGTISYQAALKSAYSLKKGVPAKVPAGTPSGANKNSSGQIPEQQSEVADQQDIKRVQSQYGVNEQQAKNILQRSTQVGKDKKGNETMEL